MATKKSTKKNAAKKTAHRKAPAKKVSAIKTPKKPIRKKRANKITTEQTPPIRPPFDIAMESLLAKGLSESFARLLLLDHMTDEQLQQLSVRDWKEMLSCAQTDNEHDTERIQQLFKRLADVAESFDQLSWLLTELRTHDVCNCDIEVFYPPLTEKLTDLILSDQQAFIAFAIFDEGEDLRKKYLEGAWKYAGRDYPLLLSVMQRASITERKDPHRINNIANRCFHLDQFLEIAALLEGDNRKKFLSYALGCRLSNPEIHVLLALREDDDTAFVEEVLKRLQESSQNSEQIIAHLISIDYTGDKSLVVPHFYNMFRERKSTRHFNLIFKAAMELNLEAEVQALLPSLSFDFKQWSNLYEMNTCALRIHEISHEHNIGVAVLEPEASEWMCGPLQLTVLSMMTQTAKTYIQWAYVYRTALAHKLPTLAAEALAKFKELIMSEDNMKMLLAMIADSSDQPNVLVEALWDELERRTDEHMPAKSTAAEPEEQTGGESGM